MMSKGRIEQAATNVPPAGSTPFHRSSPFEYDQTADHPVQQTIRVGQTVASSSDVRIVQTSIPGVTSRIDVRTIRFP